MKVKLGDLVDWEGETFAVVGLGKAPIEGQESEEGKIAIWNSDGGFLVDEKELKEPTHI